MIVWPGLRRSVSAIRRLFNSASFDAPLTHSAIPTRAATGTTATFTRATTKTWQNNDGYLVTGLAGEIGFPGARRVDNLIRLGAAQSSTLAVAANITMTLPAGAYQFSMGAGTGTATFSGTGGATGTLAASASARAFVAKTISAGTLIVTASVATLVDIQVVSMVAETDQTTPREYVSVGALDYRSENNQLYLSLPGSVSHVANSPNATANQITGDIAGVVSVALADWTPAAINTLLCKDNYGVAGSGAFSFFQNTDGKPHLVIDLGGSRVEPACTAAVTFTDTNQGILGFSRVAATGVTKFWNYANGAWAQLGTDVASTAGSLNNPAIPIGVGASSTSGAVLPANGKFYSAQLYNGIPPIFGGSGSATPVVDFNPHRDAVTPTGTFTSSTTGEVWTINGASSVIRSAYYHGSFVDGVKYFATDINGVPIPSTTLLGYSAEGARTNLKLRSNAFSTDGAGAPWGVYGTPAATQDRVGPDGALSGWTLTDNAPASVEGVWQNITLTAATYTDSVYVAKTSGAQTSYPVIYAANAGGTLIAPVTVDTTNGIATVWSAYTAFTIATGLTARCVSHNSLWWRLEFSFTGTAESWVFVYLPAASSTANKSTGVIDPTVQGSAGFAFSQTELGSFASSYIATTTIAVARNADVLTYSSAGNIDGTKGWAYVEMTSSADFARLVSMADYAGGEPMMVEEGPGVRLYDGTAFRSGLTYTNSATVVQKIATGWSGSESRVAKDGTVSAALGFDGDLGAGTRISLGGTVSSNQYLYGTIRNIRIGQRQLSSSELQAVTA